MKDKIIIPKDKIKVLTSGDRFPANGYFTFYKEDVEVEQIPETFEELCELCKGLNDKIKDIQVSCPYKKHIVIEWYNDDNTDIDIYEDGTIFVENHLVAEKRIPAQMWNIIKSLIGEE